ncbi:MAG TPA: hypothetical protein VJ946_10055, partial [Bacteroidales bacterium]|nr:hypothetical protein [Bacteroidales bacterium]
RLVVNFGTWHINEGKPQPFSFFVNQVSVEEGNVASTVGHKKLTKKPKEREWWRNKLTPFTHTAGEHRYHLETDIKYGIDKK